MEIFKTFNHYFHHFSISCTNSIKLNFFGEPRLSQKLIVQIAIISEKSLEIFGAVVKSPLFQMDFFSCSNQFFYRIRDKSINLSKGIL